MEHYIVRPPTAGAPKPAKPPAAAARPAPRAGLRLANALVYVLPMMLVAWGARRAHACGAGWAVAVLKAALVSALSWGVASFAAWFPGMLAFAAGWALDGHGPSWAGALSVVLGLVTVGVFGGGAIGGVSMATRC